MAKKIIAVVACLAIIASFVGCGKKVTFNTEDWADMEIRVAGYRLFNDDPLNYEFAAGADKFTEEYGTKVSFMVGGGESGSCRTCGKKHRCRQTCQGRLRRSDSPKPVRHWIRNGRRRFLA